MDLSNYDKKAVIFSSMGNDSLALIQLAIDSGVDFVVAYSDTKWGDDNWGDRVQNAKKWIESNGSKLHIIESEGFENLVKRKKAFPTNGMAFCSYELKIKPAMEWLEEFDPDKEYDCWTGVMRIESQARASWEEVKENSPNHGGRRLVSPMAKFTEAQRDELLAKTPFERLDHRSLECFPCVNAGLKDIQMLTPERVKLIGDIEKDLGYGVRSGKPKFMFRAKKHGGAEGIEQVHERACRGGGEYSPDQEDLFGCNSGFCGN